MTTALAVIDMGERLHDLIGAMVGIKGQDHEEHLRQKILLTTSLAPGARG